MQKMIKELKELIFNKASNIVITTHKSPDGDAIGSALASYHFLKKLGHKVHVITPNDYASTLHWLPGNKNVIIYEEQIEKANKITISANIILMLDFNNIDRIGKYGNTVANSSANKILIDHHEDPDNELAEIIISNSKSSSTAELLYETINSVGMMQYLDKNIAECLYVGIMTDTGSFKYPSTTEKTHNIISKLITYGVDNAKIHDLIYDNVSEDRVKLLGYCLNNKLLVYPENNSAIISLNGSELKRFNFKKGDTEGFVNYCLSIKDIKFAAFIVEKEGVVKLSLRSKGKIKVNEIAKKHFNGGGHINAAGGISQMSVKQTIKKLEDIIKNLK